MPRTKCPHCGWKGEVEREFVGQNLLCSECENEFLCRALKKRKPGANGMQRPRSNGGVPQRNQAPAQTGSEMEAPVSVGNWMLTMLLVGIPFVGLIMMLVWAFTAGTPKSKSNWAKAALIWTLIVIGIYAVMFLVLGATIAAAGAGGAAG